MAISFSLVWQVESISRISIIVFKFRYLGGSNDLVDQSSYRNCEDKDI